MNRYITISVLILLLSTLFTCFYTFYYKKKQSYTIETVYGTAYINEPVLQELMECPSMQRLKKINQYGPCFYVWKNQDYSRYTHSVNVMFLLRHFGASVEEQISGLLHDVSHTIFSHMGDWFFEQYAKEDSYQDGIHGWYIRQTEIPAILKKHGFEVDDILHKNGNFKMLEKSLPDICIDRLEYNLYGGFIEDVLTPSEIQQIIKEVKFIDGTLCFTDAQAARTVADISIYLTENIFAAPWNYVVNDLLAKILRNAMKIDLVSLDDVHFSIDDIIWNRLKNSDDPTIQKQFACLIHYNDHFDVVDKLQKHDVCIYQKLRAINPLIEVDGQCMRLTIIDAEYAKEYNRLKNKLKNGICLRFKNMS